MSKNRVRASEQRDQHANSRRSKNISPSRDGYQKTLQKLEYHAHSETGCPPSHVQSLKVPHAKDRDTLDLHENRYRISTLPSLPGFEVWLPREMRSTGYPDLSLPPPPPPPPPLPPPPNNSYDRPPGPTPPLPLRPLPKPRFIYFYTETISPYRVSQPSLPCSPPHLWPDLRNLALKFEWLLFTESLLDLVPIDLKHSPEISFGRTITCNTYDLHTENIGRTGRITNTKCTIRERRRMQSVPLIIEDTADASVDFYLTQWQSGDIRGQGSLNAWRRSAGRQKSWRRCPKRITVNCAQHRLLSAQWRKLDGKFFKSPLWLPEVFQRYYHVEKHDRSNKLIRLKLQNRISKKEDQKEEHDVDLEKRLTTSAKSHGANSFTLTTPRGQENQPLQSFELGTAFIRLTWEKGTRTTPIGQLDRFLPIGLLLAGRWRVLHFLRNDNHADVYLVEDIHIQSSRRHTTLRVEAHYFINQHSGNLKTAAKRKQNRLMRSERCQGNFRYDDRYMVILRDSPNMDAFELRQCISDFPALSGRKNSESLYALAERRSYAEVLRQAIFNDGFVMRSEMHGASQTEPEKKAQRSALAKAKRAEKQRTARLQKRQAQHTY